MPEGTKARSEAYQKAQTPEAKHARRHKGQKRGMPEGTKARSEAYQKVKRPEARNARSRSKEDPKKRQRKARNPEQAQGQSQGQKARRKTSRRTTTILRFGHLSRRAKATDRKIQIARRPEEKHREGPQPYSGSVTCREERRHRTEKSKKQDQKTRNKASRGARSASSAGGQKNKASGSQKAKASRGQRRKASKGPEVKDREKACQLTLLELNSPNLGMYPVKHVRQRNQQRRWQRLGP
jgi:hypothetical protein